MMRSLHAGSRWLFVSVPIVLQCVGCRTRPEDSWAHYCGGGLYPSGAISASRDESYLVFSSPDTGHGDIYRVDRDGTHRVQLTDSPLHERHPLFSPDGSTIAFVREAQGCRHVWLMDVDGSNQRQLTHGDVLDDIESFTPDGGTVMVLRSSAVITGLGRAVEPIAVAVASQQWQRLEARVQYSPDGQTTAECSWNDVTQQWDLWLADRDGGNRRLFAHGCEPRLSPASERILYAPEIEHPASRWRCASLDGTEDQEVGRVANPVFTRDGAHIIFLSPTWQRKIGRMDANGDNLKYLEFPSGYIQGFYACGDAFLFRFVSGTDRVGEIYLLDPQAWTCQRVCAISESKREPN